MNEGTQQTSTIQVDDVFPSAFMWFYMNIYIYTYIHIYIYIPIYVPMKCLGQVIPPISQVPMTPPTCSCCISVWGRSVKVSGWVFNWPGRKSVESNILLGKMGKYHVQGEKKWENPWHSWCSTEMYGKSVRSWNPRSFHSTNLVRKWENSSKTSWYSAASMLILNKTDGIL